MNHLPDEVVHLVLLFSSSIELKSLVMVMGQPVYAGARCAVGDLYNRLAYNTYWPKCIDKVPSRDLSCADMWAVLVLSGAVSGLEALVDGSSTMPTFRSKPTSSRKRQTRHGPARLWAPKPVTASVNGAENSSRSESVCVQWRPAAGMHPDMNGKCSGTCSANYRSACGSQVELCEGRSDGTVWTSRTRNTTAGGAPSRKMVEVGAVPARVQFLAVGQYYVLCGAGRHLHRLPLHPTEAPKTSTSRSANADDVESSSISALVASASDGQGTASRFVAATLLNAMKTALGASANSRSTGGVVRALCYLPPGPLNQNISDRRSETFVVLVESSCGRHWLLLVHAHRLTLAGATFVGHAPGATPGAPPSSANIGLAACWLPHQPTSSPLPTSAGAASFTGVPAVVLASSAPVLHVWLPPVVIQPSSEKSKSSYSHGTPPPPALTREGGLMALAAACTPAGSASSSASVASGHVGDDNSTDGASAGNNPAAATPQSRTLLNLGENLRRASQARAATHTGVHLALVAILCRPSKTKASVNGCTSRMRQLGSCGSGSDGDNNNHDSSHGFVSGREGGTGSGIGVGGGSTGGNVGSEVISTKSHDDEDARASSILLAVTADGSTSALQFWRLQEEGTVTFLGTSLAPESTSRHLGGVTALATTSPASTIAITAATSTPRTGTPLVLAMHRHGAATIWCPLRPSTSAVADGNYITSSAHAACSAFVCVATVPCPVLSLGSSIALKPNGDLAVAAAPNASTLAVWEQ